MKKETEKKPIKLIVSDIDNTLADFFDVWGKSIAKTVTMLSESRGMPEEDIYKAIKEQTPPSDRFYPNIAYLIKNTPALAPKNEAEKAKFEKDDAKIMHVINKMRVAGDKAYPGVVATLKKAKAAGTKIVLYTDAQMSVAIGRLANMGIPVDLVDGLYARKDDSNRDYPMFVKGKIQAYSAKIKEHLGPNLVNLPDGCWKPNPAILKDIMKSMGVENPKNVVMVGDNVKSDGGTGVGAGAEYAWCKFGASVSEITDMVYSKINTKPGYKLGVAGHEAQMSDENRPTMILVKGYSELTKYCKFVSANDNGKNKEVVNKAINDKIKNAR